MGHREVDGVQRKHNKAARSVQGAEERICTYLRCRRHYSQPGPAPLQQNRRDLSYPCTEPGANTQTALASHSPTLTWAVVVINPDVAWLQVGHLNLLLQMQDICVSDMAQLGKKINDSLLTSCSFYSSPEFDPTN